jgi:protein PhnA
MTLPSSTSAPFDIVGDPEDYVIGDIVVESLRTNYANTITVRYTEAASAAYAYFVMTSGNFSDGDTVTVIKDLKVRGASGSVKVGTKVRNIRLVDGDHDIDCKIDGFGQMGLKSEFVRKVT